MRHERSRSFGLPLLTIILIAIFFLVHERLSAQGHSPADNYYREYLESATASPADTYYNNNLRSNPPSGIGGSETGYNDGVGTSPFDGGGPPTGPGGEEEDDNTPVGVPVGEASVPGIALITMAAFIYRRKQQHKKNTNK